MHFVWITLAVVAAIIVVSIVLKFFWLLILAAIVLFFAAPKWFGKTSARVASKTRHVVRKNISEFKKGMDEREN